MSYIICSYCHSTNVMYMRQKEEKHLFKFFKHKNKWTTLLYHCKDCGKQFNHIVKNNNEFTNKSGIYIVPKDDEPKITVNEIFDKYNVTVKSGLLKNGSARLFNAETNKPISTDKQILLAYENYKDVLKYNEKPIVSKDDGILDYILPIYELGTLYYRLGKWDDAENEWFKIVELMPHAVKKLSILYRKENRFLDVIYILNKANLNKNKLIELYLNQTGNINYIDDIKDAIELYKKHSNDDVSCYVNVEWLNTINLK